MKCSRCGFDDPDDFAICTECGQPRAGGGMPEPYGASPYGFQSRGDPALGSPNQAGPDLPTATLMGIEGPVDGQEFRLDQPEMGIGRRSDCAILINDPSVSRLHAWLRGGPTEFVIEDAGSSNGTWVNGVRLIGPRPLAERDVVRIGKAAFVFQPPLVSLPQPIGGVTMVSDLDNEPSPFERPVVAFEARPVVNSSPPRAVSPPAPLSTPPRRVAPRPPDVVAPPPEPPAPVARPEAPSVAAQALSSAREALGQLRREFGLLGERLDTVDRLASSLEQQLERAESASRPSPLLQQLTAELTAAGGAERFRDLRRLLDELQREPTDIKLLVRLSDELPAINRLVQVHQLALSLVRGLESG
jgi:pSer/pThr/pTyr-binding forkhead associated (FHA) protein